MPEPGIGLYLEQCDNRTHLNRTDTLPKRSNQEDFNNRLIGIPGVLVKNHGPFTWGKTPSEAVYHATVLEKIAEITLHTLALNPDADIRRELIEKHYLRKHGPKATYGQG